ncbi:Protein MIZU-KUSSEI 1 [Dichanthelium oligosanthes]|uniref:Protein MIZU-KUSSEI 1 n=1 Tax=Dichanthelium oligosanthes TaxID=888268 RepID=A0A1E5UYJ6_9POAL|nr:Protein MIZU-KUSSEI 1 [Dichanthelium oligosanthes]
MGFAIYPAQGRPNDDDAHSRRDSLPSAGTGTTTPGDSTRTSSSSASSFDGGAASYDGGVGQQRPPRAPGHSLEAPSRRHRAGRHGASRPARLFQKLRHALPVLTPRCGRLQVGTPAEVAAAAAASSSSASSSSSSAAGAGSRLVPKGVSFSGAPRPCRRVTGTLYGHRRGRVVLALQETPRCLPSLVVELALQTHALLRELGNPAGARIVLETQRRPAAPANAGEGGARRKRGAHGPPLLDEPAWTMFCNGKKTGFAVRREATDDDLTVMETLRAVSMGAGVLPGRCSSPPAAVTATAADDEVPYMRGCFDHFIGSRDSESLYMIAPQGGGTGPELAVFFVRL